MQVVESSPPSRPRSREALARHLDTGTLLSLLLLIILLGGWQLAVRNELVPSFVLPAPSDVASRVLVDIVDPTVWHNCLYTLTAIVAGFTIAVLLGLFIGVFIALIPIVDRVLSPYVVALQTIPKVAIAPVLVIWFGFGITSKIVIVALIDFFPILVNVVLGFRSVDPRQLVLMKMLDASPWQVFCKVRVANALPSIMAGVQIAMVLSVIGAIVGEFVGSSLGLGALILQRQAAMDVIGVYSVLVVLTSIGITLNLTVKYASQKLVFWKNTDDAKGL